MWVKIRNTTGGVFLGHLNHRNRLSPNFVSCYYFNVINCYCMIIVNKTDIKNNIWSPMNYRK